ncbi:phage tail tape measure protein [Lysinibacillus sphaericus]|nr:phage tail tape measure protein [Lysinibacillus sphaericus]
MVSYTTAIGSATRESGNIIGNSLKTIFSRIGTLSKAQDALAEVGVSVRDSSGEMRDVSEIIDELGNKWQNLSKEQQQNMLINVAGTYQQNRLSALMNNWSMAISANETALNSQGSAMREQEKYNESLEARLNRLNTSWTDFSSTVGDKVLYDGVIVVTSALESMTDSGNGVVSAIGLLPPAITVATVAVYAFSGSFRALVASTYASTSATMVATGATGVFSGALVGLKTVAGLATVALRGLAIATGIGVVFAVAGVAIEKLTKIISENIQKQEELDLYLEKNTSALSSNKEEVEKLIVQYNSLSDAKANDNTWDSTKEEEYLKVQQRLGEIFPALIASVDSTGQTHLKNKDAIEQEIKATEKLIEAQNKVTVNTAIEEFEKLNDEINGSWYDSLSNYVYGSLESRIKQQKQIIESMKKNGSDTSVQELELLQLEQLYQQASEKIKAKIFEVADAQSSLKIDSNISESLQNFVSSLDFSGFDNAQLKSFADEFGRIQEQIQIAINTDDADLYNKSIKSLNDLASASKGFDKELNSFTLSYEEFTNAIEKGQIKIVEGEVVIEDMANLMGSAANSVTDLSSKMKDFKDVAESMAGVSQSGVDALNDLVLQYDMLTYQLAGYTEQQLKDIYTKENLTTKEREVKKTLDDRIAVMKEMSSLYPDLFGKDGKAIALSEEKRKAIEKESKAYEVLLKAYKLARDGKLDAEQKATLASASGTIARIENMKTEIRMLEKYTRANNIAAKIASAFNGISGLGMTAQQIASERALSDYRAELDGLMGSLNNDIGKIESFTSAIESSDKATKGSSKSQKDKNSTTKDSIYITDKYKQAIEALNLEIEKQQKLQAKYPEHSNEYRRHLEAQIKLEKEKLALQEKQAKAIQSQIVSGKIQQTGNVSSKSSTTSTTNAKVNGFDGRISSNYGQRGGEFHRGVDIASPLGSRLDAPVSGKVIKAGDATANGMSWTYGNLVVIQDDSGVKHIMAHMDKVVAKIGDYVQAGTQIGTVGSTGNSTGPHVHYEQNTANGKLIDPTSYVNQVRSGKVQVTSTSNGGNSTVDTGQQAIDQAKSDLLGLQKDVLSTKDTIDNLNELLVKSNVSYYNHLIDGVDRSIKKSNILANQQLEHSQAYRDELAKETKHLEYKQSLLHKEANFIREQLKRTDLSPAFKDELTTQLSELSLSWWDVEESIKSVDEQIENSKIAEFDKKIESLNDSISKSNKLMDMYAKGTKEYNDEQKKIISALYEKQKAYESEAEALRRSIQLEKLSIKEIERKKERLKELSSTWLDTQSEIIRINSDIADELINTMKDAYGQQRDYEIALKDKQIEDLEELRDARLKTLDEEGKAYEESMKEQMDTLDKAHKDKLDKLDEESKAFEDAIIRQLELMRKQRDEEDFNKDIGKLQKEEANIVAKINELSMDDSREAKLQRKKLEEELANIREQIADKQNDRQYELREQNLQDELDAYKSQQDAKKETEDNNYNTSKEALDKQLELYKKELEAKKNLEEEKFKATKAQLEKERQDIVNHYDQLINNEQEYANLRAQIINGSVDGMSEKLTGFLGNFKSMNKDLINELGISWQELENKIYRITQAQNGLGNISTPNQNVDLNDGSIIGSHSNSNNSSSSSSARDNAWQQYLANKKSWETASASEKKRLANENDKLRSQWGFKDGSYDSLKNLKKYHSGGIVGGKGNRLTELTNKLFNTKPNEETVLALKRELYVPENNVSNMFTNIRAALPDFKVNSPQSGTIKIDNLLSIDSVSQNANLDIDRLLDQGLNKLIDKMKPYGFNIR